MIKFCSLASGSSGNCLFIGSERTRILIDAGLSGKYIKNALEMIGEEPDKIDAILVTHDHSDHTSGVGVLSRRYRIPVYANRATWEFLFRLPGEIDTNKVREFNSGEAFGIGCFSVGTFRTPHDAGDPVGFYFEADGRRVTVATDIGMMDETLQSRLSGSNLLFIESNHDVNMLKTGPYPYFLKRRILGDLGHLSNEVSADTVRKLAQRGMERFILGHLSRENNFPALAYETANACLAEHGIAIGSDVRLAVAPRDRVGCIEYI